VVILDTHMGRVSAYRWHIEDAMPFKKSIRVTIEHGNQNDTEADYSSVAYFYQSAPHAPFPPLPANPDDLLLFTPPPVAHFPGAVEGEALLDTAKADMGDLSEQDMSPFAGTW